MACMGPGDEQMTLTDHMTALFGPVAVGSPIFYGPYGSLIRLDISFEKACPAKLSRSRPNPAGSETARIGLLSRVACVIGNLFKGCCAHIGFHHLAVSFPAFTSIAAELPFLFIALMFRTGKSRRKGQVRFSESKTRQSGLRNRLATRLALLFVSFRS